MNSINLTNLHFRKCMKIQLTWIQPLTVRRDTVVALVAEEDAVLERLRAQVR